MLQLPRLQLLLLHLPRLLLLLLLLLAWTGSALVARLRVPLRGPPRRMASSTDPLAQLGSLFNDKMKLLGAALQQQPTKAAGSEFDADILTATTLLERAAETKGESPDVVVAALVDLEKLMRAKNKADDNQTSRETLTKLAGSWRLIFTTGTVDTQKKIGQINYFPIRAIQSFDVSNMKISNGIYLFGNTAALKFFGSFTWNIKARKLEFDFDELALFGFKFALPKGGAAKIGQQTGLGSDNNVALVKQGAQPFFNWVLASDKIAVARGGGGGLALWRRDLEQQLREAQA